MSHREQAELDLKTWLHAKFVLLSFLTSTLVSVSAAQADLTLRVPVSSRFLAAHGHRAWAGGYSNNGLEIWTGALQIASDVYPEFRRAGTVSAIPGMEIVSGISVRPSHVSRVYGGPDFSVEEDIWVPLDEPSVLLSYTVRTGHAPDIIVRFRPSLNLMWPAATGGQEVHWDAHSSGYLCDEPGRQFAAVVLAPGAIAHDEPLNDAAPAQQNDELAVTLDPHSPTILFAQIPADPANREPGIVAVQALLQSTRWQQDSDRHYRDMLGSELEINTPDPDMNQALRWAEIALDQDWFCNAVLGCGYVGGFGASRRNRRPQYAWFFAGDGMVALHGSLAAGDLTHARDELRFIARYQDQQTGMIWHELSQSAPYLDWRNKYPYMFVHADLTYPYISAAADYLRASNDIVFLQEIWPSVRNAYRYGRTLLGDDELPRIPAGKEGVDEQDALTDELALSASWVKACEDYAHLAEHAGDSQAALEARTFAENSRRAFAARYWDKARSFPIQGYRRNGEAMQDRGLGAVAAIGEHLFSDAQVATVLDQIASWRFQTDWGTRNFAFGEPGYDPTAYAHGSVWAFGTADVAEAYWISHRPEIAWEIWRTLIPWSSLDSPGHMHEVLTGDTYHPQVESVPEQTWSSARFLSSVVRGLFGLEIDAENNTFSLSPHLPAEWDHASLRNIRLGNSKVDLALKQSLDGLTLNIENSGSPLHLAFRPQIPLGAESILASFNGRRAAVQVKTNTGDEHADLELSIPAGQSRIAIQYQNGIEVILPWSAPVPGSKSTGMKLTSLRMEEQALLLDLDAVAARDNRLEVRRRFIRSTGEAKLRRVGKDEYEVSVPAPKIESGSYGHEQVKIDLIH